jgi:PAS domain-containing protein
MLDDSIPELEIIHSIVNRMNGFLYRCRNDKDYTMMFMAGEVRRLTGHDPQAFTGAGRSYTSQTHPEDLQSVYDAVDAALAEKGNWNVDYRIIRPDGSAIWVQEIGGGVYQQYRPNRRGFAHPADSGHQCQARGRARWPIRRQLWLCRA